MSHSLTGWGTSTFGLCVCESVIISSPVIGRRDCLSLKPVLQYRLGYSKVCEGCVQKCKHLSKLIG